MTAAYSSEDCEAFARALDRAWERFLRAGRLGPDNIDTAKAALTYAILSAADDGERDPAVLAERGLQMMDMHASAVAEQRIAPLLRHVSLSARAAAALNGYRTQSRSL